MSVDLTDKGIEWHYTEGEQTHRLDLKGCPHNLREQIAEFVSEMDAVISSLHYNIKEEIPREIQRELIRELEENGQLVEGVDNLHDVEIAQIQRQLRKVLTLDQWRELEKQVQEIADNNETPLYIPLGFQNAHTQ